MIDFTKPLQTTPCEVNEQPVQCSVVEVHKDGESARVAINGPWFDRWGNDMNGSDWIVRGVDGQCIAFDMAVRNLV